MTFFWAFDPEATGQQAGLHVPETVVLKVAQSVTVTAAGRAGLPPPMSTIKSSITNERPLMATARAAKTAPTDTDNIASFPDSRDTFSHDILFFYDTPPSTTISRSYALSKDFLPAEVNLDNIEPLDGLRNYGDWASQMIMVFDAMNVLDIVVDGAQLDPNASSADKEGYQALSNHALLILIQVISKPILKKVSRYRSPHLIWKYLKETYVMDTSFTLVHQIAGLCLLFTKLDKDKPLSNFMDKFDEQWSRVYQASGGPDPYRQKFKAFLEEDFAKRDFLLAALSQSYPNPVYKMTTNSNLTYSEVRRLMLGLASNNQLEDSYGDTALFTSNKRKFGRGRKSPSESSKTCSYCKKHGGTSLGHVWQDCRKLKRDQKRKQDRAEKNQPSNQQQGSSNQGLIAAAFIYPENWI
ncbi:hypothetical protein BGX38DRAFT_1275480 [Terfezia claveryi]|nr:hypothetical protein BGX38DRAFT_1275480 [Terfezia claveryi]